MRQSFSVYFNQFIIASNHCTLHKVPKILGKKPQLLCIYNVPRTHGLNTSQEKKNLQCFTNKKLIFIYSFTTSKETPLYSRSYAIKDFHIVTPA